MKIQYIVSFKHCARQLKVNLNFWFALGIFTSVFTGLSVLYIELKTQNSLKTQLVCFLSSSFEACVVSGLFGRERKGGGGREGLELIIHKGVGFTQQISSLVSICDAKAWSHKKEEKEKL